MKDWIILANGNNACQKFLQQLVKNKKLLVIDGAYQYAIDCGLTIDVLLGDFDSIDPNLLKSIQNKKKSIKVIHAYDQNKTDLEKACEYLIALKAKQITITGAIGDEFDHSLYNVQLLKKFYSCNIKFKLISANQQICYLYNETISLPDKVGNVCSLFGFPKAIATSNGLKYELNNYPLNFFKNNSARNIILNQNTNITINGEALLVITKS